MTHPQLSRNAKKNPGIYTPKDKHKDCKGESSIYIGDPFHDPHKTHKSSSRFGGKQFVTNPPKNTSGGGGHFEKMTYSSSSYNDKTTYTKDQPNDSRKLGFGSHDAARRGEFTTSVRTEQYREQLVCEATKVNKSGSGDALDALADEFEDVTPKKKSFLYDIGRSTQTEFDPKSSKDTYYNALECKSRIRPERNNGSYQISSQAVGQGTKNLDHSTCKPQHGHIKATKTFFDKSHIGEAN